MDGRLRILTVANVAPNPDSGAAGTVFHTNAALRARGHDVTELWADDLPRRRIGHHNLYGVLEQPKAYRHAVLSVLEQGEEFDVIQISQPQAFLTAKALKNRRFRGLVVNRSHGVELLVDKVVPRWHRKLGISENRFPRSLLTPILRRMLHRQWYAVAKYADGVVVPCQTDADCLLDSLPSSRCPVRVVHHGVSSAFFSCSAKAMTQERASKMLYVGQFSFFKGPHLLAKIVERVLERNPGVTMTWVTPIADHDRARSLIKSQFHCRVSFSDWCEQSRLVDLYDSHGVFVFPSLFEGAGKASLEAMARGLCVVASDTGGMRDYVQSGVNGVLCPVGDVDGFVAAANRLVGGDCLHEMSSSAAEYARQKTWEVCAAGLERFYRSLRGVSR